MAENVTTFKSGEYKHHSLHDGTKVVQPLQMTPTTSFPSPQKRSEPKPQQTDVAIQTEPAGREDVEKTKTTTPVTSPLPSKKRTTKCQCCGVPHGSPQDNSINSIWLGCESKGCEYWIHLCCLGLLMKKSRGKKADEAVEETEDIINKHLQYFCPKHVEKYVKSRK
jgi:hypothetical protein